ncbi:hypothetical protein [Streptomyces sp. NPDC047043]|uniref:hypothetical protein n=1 Tax=Streptomyces sp. NPDC047043 TaxID=3154497 RepID=UPI0033C5A8A3
MSGRGSPAVLTGRKAIAYKNATLNGAKRLFRHPGPVLTRRRHLIPDAEAGMAHTGRAQA